jgi:hypothetical protein
VRGFLTVVVAAVVVVLGLVTRPVVTFVVRGLDVFAFVVFLGVRTDSIAWTTRGLEFPGGGVSW